MSSEELKKDSEELAKFIGEATRKRVKDALTTAKAEVDREIVNLEMKAKHAEERKHVQAKRYITELTEYAWDQSDKFVKLFVSLDGVQNLDESAVVVKFTESTMNLHVNNLNEKDYGLIVNNLLEPIDVVKSYRKIKNGLVAIYLKKVEEGKTWSSLTTIQKRLKDIQNQDMMPDKEDPQDALFKIMKKMYLQGDTKTKQMIAKTWTECQEKNMAA
uniref:Calcyclin-binding protein n=1 Tax=Glossina brevipalpis TaxID=37001 RepID=A0A1A9WA24_9MUSC